jgi:hypothetical protein
MKKLIFLIIMVSLCCSCNNEKEMVLRNGKVVEEENNSTYTWSGCKPKPLNFEKSEYGVDPTTHIAYYWYYFHISLDNSQADASNVTISDVYIPHVGPNGKIIYNNVGNDATYEVIKIENGVCYFKIKTADVVSTGCPLKFNLALLVSGNYVWFSANGAYTQNVGIDDGVNNIYFIIFKGGSITRAF